jgi:hypothetical protein
LLLAMLEKMVTDAGGTYLMCDTDSMAIVSSENSGLVPRTRLTGWKEGAAKLPHPPTRTTAAEPGARTREKKRGESAQKRCAEARVRGSGSTEAVGRELTKQA